MLDMNIIHNENFRCYDSVIATAAEFLGRQYELMFLESWDFNLNPFNNEEIHIGSILKVSEFINCHKLLAKYHGIEIKYHDCTDETKLLDLIGSEIENYRPLRLRIDSYWLPWDVLYKKSHENAHFLLINNIDFTTKTMNLTDPFFNKKNEEIPFGYVIKGCKSIASFELLRQTGDLNWEKELKSILEKNKDMFSNMNIFAGLIEENLDYHKEIYGYDQHFKTPLFVKIQDIAYNRGKFACSIDYIIKNYNADYLIEFSEKLKLVNSKWIVVLSMLTKGFILADMSTMRMRVARKLREIAIDEQLIAEGLLDAINSNSLGVRNRNACKDEITFEITNEVGNRNIVMLDIANFFNCNGFSNKLGNSNANFDGYGNYLWNHEMPQESVWHIGEMMFSFLPSVEDECDNISLMKQSISVPEIVCDSIMMISSADGGNLSETVRLQFIDGSTEDLIIRTTDWTYDPYGMKYENWKPKFNELIAWEGKGIDFQSGQPYFNARLYAKEYKIKSKKPLISIDLPYCPNIHIFSISLSKS